IWSYWDEDPLDSLATTCKASWTTYAPSYEISTITLASVADYNLKLPSNFYSLGAAAKSDAVRLAILFEKGGIWLDAHVLLRRPIAWIEDFVASAEIDSPTPIFAPPGSSSRPYVESWLVVVPEPKNPLVEKWSTTLSSTLEFVSNSSLLSSPAYSLTKWCTTDNDYFMVYQTFCHLSERDASFRSGVVRLPIWTFFAINPFFFPWGFEIFDRRRVVKYSSDARSRVGGFKLFGRLGALAGGGGLVWVGCKVVGGGGSGW
ncbi:hypothetical protein ScalyP_jg2524, partial [Parmales sp. scaly parma]